MAIICAASATLGKGVAGHLSLRSRLVDGCNNAYQPDPATCALGEEGGGLVTDKANVASPAHGPGGQLPAAPQV